jgi:hypothetical protein
VLGKFDLDARVVSFFNARLAAKGNGAVANVTVGRELDALLGGLDAN